MVLLGNIMRIVKMKRNYAMDLLKFVLTILIGFHHYQQITGIKFEVINFWGGAFYVGHLVEFFYYLRFLNDWIYKKDTGWMRLSRIYA